MKRVATAVVLAPLIAWVIIASPAYIFYVVLATVAGLCFWEYAGIAAGHGIQVPRVAGIVAGVFTMFHPEFVVVTILVMIGVLFLGDLREALPRSAATMLGLLYVFGCWRTAIDLRLISPHWLFFAIALNWIGDTAGMYVGRAFGRHKLAPRVSPGKSWEGSIASMIASVLFGVLYGYWLLPMAPVWLTSAAAGAGNIAGQLGDLSESAMKRGAGMKDSSRLLPGHGGWLDRVDGSLFSMPVVLALLHLVGL